MASDASDEVIDTRERTIPEEKCPVQIHVRKGSETPSMSEQKSAAAPMASFEDLDSDVDSKQSDADEVFSGGEAECQGGQAPPRKKLDIPPQRPPKPKTPPRRSPVTVSQPSRAVGTDTKAPPPRPPPPMMKKIKKSPSPQREITPGHTNTGEETMDIDTEIATITRARSPIEDQDELTYVERKLGKNALETRPIDRPRSTTPINLATLDDYIGGESVAVPEKNGDVGKIRITLPGEEFEPKARSSKKSPSDTAWLHFNEDQLFSHSLSAVVSVLSGEGNKVDSPKRVLMPRSPKRPAPLPPNSAASSSSFPLPPDSPLKTALSNSMKKNWETFEGVSGSISSFPSVSITPPVKPVSSGDDDPFCTKAYNASGESGITGEMSSFDDESSLFTDMPSPTEKQHKLRGLSPKRAIRGIVANTGKKSKSPKKEKKKEQLLKEEDLEKFIPYEERLDEKSDEWLAYQEMEERIKATMQKTQERMSKLGSSEESGNESASTKPASSAWVAFGDDGEPIAKADNKSDWEGFEDNFSVTPNIELSSKLPHLNVSPVPSPRHDPLPPNNSRRESVDEESKLDGLKSVPDVSEKAEVDLLGLSSEAPAGNQTGSMSVSAHADLLGLDSFSSTPPTSQQMSASADLTSDFMALSRNTTDSIQSSSTSTPTPFENEFLGLSSTTTLSSKPTEPTGPSLGSSIVDDFLGLTGSAAEPVKPQSTNPMDILAGLGSATASSMQPTTAGAPQFDLLAGSGDSPPLKPAIAIARQQAYKKPVDPFSDLFKSAAGLPKQESKPETMTEMFADTSTGTELSTSWAVDSEPAGDLFGGVSADLTAPSGGGATHQTSTAGQDQFDLTLGVVEVANSAQKDVTPLSDEFDPRSDFGVSGQSVADSGVSADVWGQAAPAEAADNAFEADFFAVQPAEPVVTIKRRNTNPFLSEFEDPPEHVELSSTNPFASELAGQSTASAFDSIPFADDTETQGAGEGVGFNPFAYTAMQEEQPVPQEEAFDPFQTIHEDDHAFELAFGSRQDTSAEQSQDDMLSPGLEPIDNSTLSGVSPPRFNPFDKEPPLDAKFANFEPKPAAEPEKEKEGTPKEMSSESSLDAEEEEALEPLAAFHIPPPERDGWKLFLRMPLKKKLTGNRFWKSVYVRLAKQNTVPTVKLYSNEGDHESFHELPLQACYNLCNMGLQTYDQFGKCHTVKLQYVFYRERVGVKTERITPTLSDLTRVRDLKGLRDLVHKPKTTMILDHAPQTSELLKFGGLDYDEFRSFIWQMEDALMSLEAHRDKTLTYTKDEITADVIDEYVARVDKDGHIVEHKARVRVFCLAFLTGMPTCEFGLNDKKRRGKEVVGRHDIIPVKTEEWIRMEDPEFHCSVKRPEYEKTRLVKFHPLDACHYEVMRFRVRPRLNKELPLQARVQMVINEKHVEIRAEVIVPGYYSNSRRAAQTPCEDVQIRIPVPEPWIYLFRVEKRFGYGSIKAATRKPGKIKGLERLTMIAQGILPPSLIEVSTGSAKYENIFKAVVWRMSRLPERNEGAYKTHLFICKLDLGPHDTFPDAYEKYADVEFTMPSTTCSGAQIRSISVGNPDPPPDKWVNLQARYVYKVEVEWPQPAKPEHEYGSPDSPMPESTDSSPEAEHKKEAAADDDDSDSSDD